MSGRHGWNGIPTMMEIVPDFYIDWGCTAQRNDNSSNVGSMDSTVFPESYGDVEKDCITVNRRTLRPPRPYMHRARKNR